VATFDALWRRDRHHPSIILWGLLAECATQTEAGERFFARLAAEVRQRDTSRLIIQASETPDGDRCFQYADVLGLNYFHGWYADAPIGEYGEALDRLHARFPDKPILLSSHGADAIAGFRSFHNAKWSEEAQAEYHAAVIAEVRRRPFVAGQSIWLLADYQGPAWRTARFTPLQRPKEQNNKGLLDEYRRPKLAYDKVQALYRDWADE
jgi:beta-glucuronidase